MNVMTPLPEEGERQPVALLPLGRGLGSGGSAGRKQRGQENSKVQRGVKNALRRRRTRLVYGAAMVSLGIAFGISYMETSKYFAIEVDRILLHRDILALEKGSVKRWVLETLEWGVDKTFPQYEGYGRMDEYKDSFAIDPKDAQKIGLVMYSTEEKPVNIFLKVSSDGFITLDYHICDYTCAERPKLLALNSRRIGKIERGRIYFLASAKLDGDQRKFVADSLRKTPEVKN